MLLALAAAAVGVLADEQDVEDHSGHDPFADASAHEAGQGLLLASDPNSETVTAGPACSPDAPVRAYQIVAINVEMTLNRFLDYDPQGRMYVLEDDLGRVRAEETQNREARAGRAEPAISVGLQGDAIQPLTLRVNQGECLRISLRNDLRNGEPASLHLHGSALRLGTTGAPAIATNPDAVAASGQTVLYEWAVPNDEQEGTHSFHSHGDAREQTNHGLFGAVIVEPRGSQFLDPTTGSELRSGWSAIIQDPRGPAFREFAFYYHEIGNERYRHLDRNSRLVVQVDPFTSAYRPGDRALNYRSEPFMNRLALQQQIFGKFDKSSPYSSYSFGDPATPIARSYLGDPVKQRVIHGGSEVFHVHHVHGGAIRWPRQPGAEPTAFSSGLDKHPPLIPQASERLDSQSIGPSETYDVTDECGSGGCQQSAGDFLVHCHIAHHYLAGMWGIWRVYNTLQGAAATEDALPALAELPDRLGQMQPAITSQSLVGRTVDWQGQTFQVTAQNLNTWVERQLPPRGAPRGYDASVLDWDRQGDLYVNEPETDQAWPGYQSLSPGARPPLLFDPRTGKLAYPFLRPHLGKRPPFAPNHGPAPFLDPIQQGTDVPKPGENGPWSVCPAGTTLKQFSVLAINLLLPLAQRAGISDPTGAIYVLQDQENAIRSNDAMKTPLAIRANAGEDCVDVLLKSKLEDSRENGLLSKVDVHIHFVQFDVQASDGVNTGFNYEQSVRPFTVEGEKLTAAATEGASSVHLSSVDRFQPGAVVGVGMDQDRTFEVKRIRSVEGDALVFDEALRFAHAAGEIVSTEFVRYRWYPDVQFGTAYFHDHVDALHSWRHGLFGALVSEPPGSTYHDSHTGAELRSGPIADVHTKGVVSADVVGSFREALMFIQDDNLLTKVGDGSGSSYNLRAEPLAARGGDPSRLFSSQAHGDPATPLLEAFVGDPLVVRNLVAGTNEVHTWHLDGHWFRAEPFSSTSPPVNTAHLGISERYDLYVPRAGGPQGRGGDYLYYSGRAFKLREGSWGILRVYDAGGGGGLQRLPGRETGPGPPPPVCPGAAPQRTFPVAAIEAPLPMLGGASGKMYVLQADKDAVRSGDRAAEPLALHVSVGDCIVAQLTNETAGPVSFHADLLAHDPANSSGVDAGNNAGQMTPPGETRTYTFFASPEVGETTALVRDWGNVIENPRLGLYGAIVVGPRGARFTDPITGEDVSDRSSWRADVHPPVGPAYRDFTLFLQDEDEIIGTAQMPYVEQVRGVVGLNYRAEPLQARLARDRDTSKVFMSSVHGDPATPVLEALVGDPVKIHVLSPFSEQAHVFSVEGHQWPLEPGRAGSDLLSSAQLGGLEAITISLADGAGGQAGLPGDYLYGDHREPFRDAGLWGLFRVYPRDATTRLQPL
jgi:hypothetical protein